MNVFANQNITGKIYTNHFAQPVRRSMILPKVVWPSINKDPGNEAKLPFDLSRTTAVKRGFGLH